MTDTMVNPFDVVTTSEDRPNIGEFTADDDAPLRCEVCGTPLVYGGRGRKPKRCEEHRRGNASNTPTSGGNRSLASLREPVANLYRGLGFGVGMFVSSEDGMDITTQADAFADAWIELAKTDPKVAKFLRNVTKSSGWGAVLAIHASVGFKIASRHGAREKLFGR